MVCQDGVVIAVEKIVNSRLYEPGVNKRIFIIDQHIGMVTLRDHIKSIKLKIVLKNFFF